MAFFLNARLPFSFCFLLKTPAVSRVFDSGAVFCFNVFNFCKMKLFKLLALFLLGFLLNSQNISAQTLADLSGVTWTSKETAIDLLGESIHAIKIPDVQSVWDDLQSIEMRKTYYADVQSRLMQDQPFDKAVFDAYVSVKSTFKVQNNTREADALRVMFFEVADRLKG